MVHAHRHLGCIATLLSTLLFAGCDGGLFGTGSVDADNGDIGAVDSSVGDGTTGGMPATEGDDGTSGGADGVAPDVSTPLDVSANLENSLAVQPGPPTVDLLNFADSDRVVLVAGNDQRVIASVARRERLFDITLAPDSEPLRVLDEANDRVLADYTSVALAQGSQTSLAAREPTLLAPPVIALTTRVSTEDPTLALVRFVLTVALGAAGDEPTGELTLEPLNDGEPTTGVSFGTRSYASPDSGYRSLLPGRYALRDSLGRVTGSELELLAGQVVTLYAVAGSDDVSIEPVVDGDSRSDAYLDTTTTSANGSAVRTDVLHQGDGAIPRIEDSVTFDYTGRLLDGTLFDSSYDRGMPVSTVPDALIDGFRDGLLQMPVGSRHRFIIPPELAYGTGGSPPAVPPDATLVFEVDLLGIAP